MNTKRFRTRTELLERGQKKAPGVWEIALDIGYSGVKGMSPNKIYCFPSYAKRIDESFTFANKAPRESILYKNLQTNEMWIIGEVAQNMIATGDTSDSEASLYGRERYYQPMFKAYAEAGLGVGLLSNAYGTYNGEKIVLQTGLPERYMSDSKDLIDALSGTHEFAIKIGEGDWQQFSFELSDIYVMSQPKGTLFSVCIDKEGQFIKDAPLYLRSSVLVGDGGFGTMDLFSIIAGVVGNGETFTDLGMKRVLQELSKIISAEYKVDIPVPAMQKYLETGKVKYLNKKTLEAKEYPIDILLAKASNQVCDEAITRIINTVNIIDYDFFIVTGGTCAAWMHYIEEKFKNFKTLKIIKGNQNDELPFIYSNVRGYYYYRYNKLLRQET